MAKYGLNLRQIFGHYEFDTAIVQGKTCPNLNANWMRKFIGSDPESENHETS